MRAASLIAGFVVVVLLMAGIAEADRRPTEQEKAQIASVVHLRVICARVRISTVTKKPKWATVAWKRGGPQCDASASNGVTVTKKTNGRWRFVTAGSSFRCSDLYDEVPRAIAKDLRIRCDNF